MIRFFGWLFELPQERGDLSRHRVHTSKYEDMCQ